MVVDVERPANGTTESDWWDRVRKGEPPLSDEATRQAIVYLFGLANTLGLITRMDPTDQSQTLGQRMQYSLDVTNAVLKQLAGRESLLPAGTDLGRTARLQGQALAARSLQSSCGQVLGWAGNTATVVEQMVADDVGTIVDHLKTMVDTQMKSGRVDPELLAIFGPIKEELDREAGKKKKTAAAKTQGRDELTARLDELELRLAAKDQEIAYWQKLAARNDQYPPVPPPATPGTGTTAPAAGTRSHAGHAGTPNRRGPGR